MSIYVYLSVDYKSIVLSVNDRLSTPSLPSLHPPPHFTLPLPFTSPLLLLSSNVTNSPFYFKIFKNRKFYPVTGINYLKLNTNNSCMYVYLKNILLFMTPILFARFLRMRKKIKVALGPLDV